jgi:hypothetical protein
MNYIWYESLVEALRHHIEAKHMMEDDALDELRYAEEYLQYESWTDGQQVELSCPWSIHCKCNWSASGRLEFKFKPLELKQ